jgi:ElaB/YqjD/DUF883 family membrane-anchored ribosome-binding protein
MTDTKLSDEADFTADLTALRADVAGLAASVRSLVATETAATTDAFAGAADAARRRLAAGASEAQELLSGARSDLEAQIERNPLVAVLIALGAGLVIGLVSRGHK